MEKCPVKIKHNGGLPLLSENLPYDFNTVYSLRKYNMLYRSKAVIPLLALLPGAAVILAAMKFLLIALILCAVFLCVLYLTVLSLKPAAMKIYERAYKNESLRLFSFYDGYFTVETEKAALVLDYGRIERIISRDTYLMIFLNNGLEFAVPEKAECFDGIVSLLNEKTKGQIHK